MPRPVFFMGEVFETFLADVGCDVQLLSNKGFCHGPSRGFGLRLEPAADAGRSSPSSACVETTPHVMYVLFQHLRRVHTSQIHKSKSDRLQMPPQEI